MTKDRASTVTAALEHARIHADTSAIRRLAGGANSDVFEVGVPDSPPVVVKLYSDDLAWKLEKEVYVYGLLGSLVAVPRALAWGTVEGVSPTSYLILTKLDGVLAAEVISGCSPSEVEGLYEEIGQTMRGIHQVTFDEFGYLTTKVLDPHPTNESYMRFQFDKKLREFTDHQGPDAIRLAIERRLEGAETIFAECSRAVLCHDDIHEGNVLVTRSAGVWHVNGIVDVENAVAADPLIDLAKTDYYAVRGSREKRRGLLRGYGPLTGGWQAALHLYRIYHALELWDWFAYLGNTDVLDPILEDLRLFAGDRSKNADDSLSLDEVGAKRSHVEARTIKIAMEGPPTAVVSAFGLEGTPERLDGGEGTTWLIGSAVLKPVGFPEQMAWEADIFKSIKSDGFRIPRSLRAEDGSFVVDGWAAWQHVEGRHVPRRWAEIIAVGETLHAALAGVARPGFLDGRTDPWAIGDRVAWGELSPADFPGVKHLDRLASALRPVDEQSQLIHGDLTGNVLFADGLPPAVIDFSPYWRPTGFASAIVVADALVWEAADERLLDAVAHVKRFEQFLLRALIYRAVTDQLFRKDQPVRSADEDPYLPVVDLAVRLARAEE